MSRWLVCRERFRLRVVEGLKPVDSFNHRIEFGSCWHILEENFARTGQTEKAFSDLHTYVASLCKKYPLQQEQIVHWHDVCKTTFPIYCDYWKNHPDVKDRTPLLQEQVFKVPYKLPSGRVVYIRGKWDSVDLIGKGKNAGIFLQENKTKGDIKEEQIVRQMSFDLQTMIYLIALESDRSDSMGHLAANEEANGFNRKVPIKGVRYNVIRRPLSGGKGSIVQHKPTKSNPAGETREEYYARLGTIIKENSADFFARWQVLITPQDVERFKRECLDPILEQLCDWWNFVAGNSPPYCFDYTHTKGIHWRHPFGVYNVLNENGSSDVDQYLESGSELGLVRGAKLFEELET